MLLSIHNTNSFPMTQSLNTEKKEIPKDESLERDYPEVRSDFSLEVVDKTLVNVFPGFLD